MDAFETTHLKVLSWILGVHKKATNNFCFGDTGILPWAISVIPQCLRYFERGQAAANGPDCVNSLLHHEKMSMRKWTSNGMRFGMYSEPQANEHPTVGSLDISSGGVYLNHHLTVAWQYRHSITVTDRLKMALEKRHIFNSLIALIARISPNFGLVAAIWWSKKEAIVKALYRPVQENL